MTKAKGHNSLIDQFAALYTQGWRAQAIIYATTFSIVLAVALIQDFGAGKSVTSITNSIIILVPICLIALPLGYIVGYTRFAARRKPSIARYSAAQRIDQAKRERDRLAHRPRELINSYYQVLEESLVVGKELDLKAELIKAKVAARETRLKVIVQTLDELREKEADATSRKLVKELLREFIEEYLEEADATSRYWIVEHLRESFKKYLEENAPPSGEYEPKTPEAHKST